MMIYDEIFIYFIGQKLRRIVTLMLWQDPFLLYVVALGLNDWLQDLAQIKRRSKSEI